MARGRDGILSLEALRHARLEIITPGYRLTKLRDLKCLAAAAGIRSTRMRARASVSAASRHWAAHMRSPPISKAQ